MKKSQGEIFGIALLFVVIIVGVIIYGQIKTLSPEDQNEKSQKREKYEVLAAGSLDSILSMSTGCEVERGKDTLTDLIKFCEYTYYGEDPQIMCKNGVSYGACAKTLDILNQTLNRLYNNSEGNGIGQMPFKLEIYTTNNADSKLNTNISNFNNFKYKSVIITENNYSKNGFNKAPSGLRTIPTAKRNVNFELSLYFRD